MSVSKKRLEELKAIPEEDIDTSDIPELEQEFWENAELVHPQHLNEAMLKARLAIHIASIIHHRGLTQQEAADVLGVEQPRVSALMRGNLYRFSAARLFDFLNALDRDIEIVIRRKPKKRSRAHTVVVSPPTSRKAS